MDEALDAPWYVLAFPPRLEARYLADTWLDRMRYQRRVGLVALFAFLGCLPADAQMLPDSFPLAVMLRGASFLIGLLLLARLRPSSPVWLPDAVMSFFVFAGALVVIVLFARTHASGRSVYFDGLLLIVMGGHICLQQRFQRVIVSCTLVLAMSLATLVGSNVGAAIFSVQAANLTIAVAMTLAITHRLEHQHRRAYLLGLRDADRKAELQRSNAALLDLSALDGLTGLPNRRTVDRHLAATWLGCAASGQPVGVLMLDVDWFKPYNDTYGHPAGDACLIALAGALAQTVRTPGDLAGRYGGEEFIVILPGANSAAVHQVAERICAAVSQLQIPHAASPCGGIVTVSIGVASAPATDATTSADLLQSADAALYTAKQSGRARIAASEPPAS